MKVLNVVVSALCVGSLLLLLSGCGKKEESLTGPGGGGTKPGSTTAAPATNGTAPSSGATAPSPDSTAPPPMTGIQPPSPKNVAPPPSPTGEGGGQKSQWIEEMETGKSKPNPIPPGGRGKPLPPGVSIPGGG